MHEMRGMVKKKKKKSLKIQGKEDKVSWKNELW